MDNMESAATTLPNGKHIYIDELLCFISNKIDTLDVQTIINLCTNFYSDELIDSSKKLCFKIFKDNENITLRKRQGRDKSINNIRDIISIFQTLGSDIPKFVAADLSNLPPITVNSIDVSGFLTKLSDLQTEMCNIKSRVDTQDVTSNNISNLVKNNTDNILTLKVATKKNTNDASSLNATIKKNSDDIKRGPNPIPNNQATTGINNNTQHNVSGNHNNRDNHPHTSSTDNNSNRNGVSSSGPINNVGRDRPPTRSINLANMSVANTNQIKTTPSTVPILPITNVNTNQNDPTPSEPVTNASSWRDVVSRNRGRPQPQPRSDNRFQSYNYNNVHRQNFHNQPRGRTRGGIGMNNREPTRAVTKKETVFSTSWEYHTTEQDVLDTLERHNRLRFKIMVEKLNLKSIHYSSFKITAEGTNPESLLYSPYAWPEGIVFKPYFQKRSSPHVPESSEITYNVPTPITEGIRNIRNSSSMNNVNNVENISTNNVNSVENNVDNVEGNNVDTRPNNNNSAQNSLNNSINDRVDETNSPNSAGNGTIEEPNLPEVTNINNTSQEDLNDLP